MKFTYKVDEQDYVNYFLYRTATNPDFKRKANRNNLILTLLYIFFGFSNLFREMYVAGTLFILAGILFWFLNPRFNRWYYRKYYGRQVKKTMSDIIGTQATIEIKESSIELRDHNSNAAHQFKADEFGEIVNIPSNAILLFKKENGVLIPQSTVERPEEFQKELAAFAKRNQLPITDKLSWKW